MTPPQAWLNLTPWSCGKVVKKFWASVSKVSTRWSYSSLMPLP